MFLIAGKSKLVNPNYCKFAIDLAIVYTNDFNATLDDKDMFWEIG